MGELQEKKIKLHHWLIPISFVGVLWCIKWYEEYNHVSFYEFGVYPRALKNLIGVITSPFIHGDLNHLYNNSPSLIILGFSILYFYQKIAGKVFLWIWFMSGLWLWALARPSFHIGASNLIYGMASFVFFSGVFRRHYKLLALSLFVVFLYGGMVWGVFPTRHSVSFEAHAYGAIAGIILAYIYRKEGPQKKKYDWEDEDDDGDVDDEDGYWNQKDESSKTVTVNYNYKDRESDK